MFNRQFLSVLTDNLIVSVEEAKTIGRLDQITDDDLAQYYTIINVWCAMCVEYSPWTGYYVLEYIKRFGLKRAIREANKVSSRLLKAMQTGIDYEIDKLIAEGNSFGLILDEIRKSSPITSMVGNAKADDSSFVVSREEVILQLLRFPKRLTFVHVDKSASISEFKQWDNRNKLRDRNPDSEYILKVRDILSDIIPWNKVVARCAKLHVYDTLPAGTTAEGYKTYGEKLNAFLPWFGSIFGVTPPIPKRIREWECPKLSTHKESTITKWTKFPEVKYEQIGKTPKYRAVTTGKYFASCYEEQVTSVKEVIPKGTVAKLAAVPKNLDESRIIAMEPVVSQTKAAKLLEVWYDYVEDLGILLKRQDAQGELAVTGSKWGLQEDPMCPCTIDAHRASDSITKGQIRTIFPAQYLEIVEELTPWCYISDERCYTLYGAATSGNALTFIHECLFFKAAGMLGCLLAYPLYFNHACPSNKVVSSWVTVVGDDLIVPAFAYETCLFVLEKLGIKVNEDKSYGPGVPFRESCGYDAFNGEIISSVYWPRRPVLGTVENGRVVFKSDVNKTFDPSSPSMTVLVDTVGSLINLQRGLYRTFPKAATILGQILLKSHPNLVSRPSPIGAYDLIGTSNTVDKVKDIDCAIMDLSGKYKSYHIESQRFVLHRVAVPRVEKLLPSTPKGSEYELLRYIAWLINGPEYFDPVCELAGCSRPSTFSLEGMFGVPVIKWQREFK